MEYLQYTKLTDIDITVIGGFKPCYKWNTFNTDTNPDDPKGILTGFKPCYKWNTFNTCMREVENGFKTKF